MDIGKLAKLGLSHDVLVLLKEHLRNGTIEDILRYGEIAFRRIDTETTCMDTCIHLHANTLFGMELIPELIL